MDNLPDWLENFGFLIIILVLIGQVYRYFRISNVVQQLQTRWFLFATAVFLAYATFIFFIQRIFLLPVDPGPSHLFIYIANLYLIRIVFALIPLSIGIALFRYRLWDIDLIIRRTLVYGVLSGLLGLVYFGSVVLLRQLLSGVTGNSSVAIVLSTLLIAALFSPLRRALQAGIDRRFFRRKYDSAQAVAAFSATSRGNLSLEELNHHLIKIINQTLEPEHASLRLKKASLAAPGNALRNASRTQRE